MVGAQRCVRKKKKTNKQTNDNFEFETVLKRGKVIGGKKKRKKKTFYPGWKFLLLRNLPEHYYCLISDELKNSVNIKFVHFLEYSFSLTLNSS